MLTQNKSTTTITTVWIYLLASIHILSIIGIGTAYSFLRITEILIIDSFIIYIILSNKSKDSLVVIFKNKALFLLIMLMVFQSSYSRFTNLGFETVQQYLISTTYFLFAFSISFLIATNKKTSFKDFIVCIVRLYSLTVIAIIILSAYDNITLNNSVEVLFENRRFFNNIQTLMSPILFYFFFTSNSKINKLFYFTIITISILIIFSCGARGTLYSLAFASLIVFLTSNSNVKQKIIFSFGLFLLLFLVQFFILDNIMQNTSSNNLYTIDSSGRFEIYSTMLRAIADAKYIFNAIGFSSTDIEVTGFLHPHNLFFYIFLGSGTLGLLLSFIVIINYFRIIYKKYRTTNHLYYKMLTVSFLSTFFHSLLSGVYITPYVAIYIFLFFSYYGHIHRAENITSIRYNTTQNNTLIKLLLLSIIIINLTSLKKALDIELKTPRDNKTVNVPGILLHTKEIYEVK